jgi:hypothetical protein
MPRASDQDDDAPGAKDDSARQPKTPRRKRVPSPDSVISETTITSPKGRVYRVIRTNQKDAYDEPASKTEAAPPGETGNAPDEQQPRKKGKRRRKS